MAAILDLSNKAPMAGVELSSREKAKYMALAIRGPNLVLLGRFEQFRSKYGLIPLSGSYTEKIPMRSDKMDIHWIGKHYN